MENNEEKNEDDGEVEKEPFYKNKSVISLVVVAVLLIAFAAYVKEPNLKSIFVSGLSAEEAKNKVDEFIKNNLVQPGTEISIKSVTEENGLFKATVSVGQQEIVSYLTKDGKKFFPQVMDIAEVEAKAQEAKKQEDEEANKEMPKADKPAIDLYVMSFCPYGNKAEDTLRPVYDLLKNKADFNFHYIVTSDGNEIQSLHGQKEVDQNEREACVLKESGKDKWFSFVTYVNKNCGSDGTCWEAGAKAAGLNTAKINTCVKAEGAALMKADEKNSNTANASGSPTMTINGVSTRAVYQYGNSEAYKKAICDTFTTAPEECAKALSAETSTAQGGSCGN